MAADEDEVAISVTINKQYNLTENINPSNDISKLIKIDKNDVSLNGFREKIINAFDQPKSIAMLFNNAGYEWKLYSYDPNKADIEIGDDDDLETEVEDAYPSDVDSEEDEDESNDQCLKLRVVFFASYVFLWCINCCVIYVPHNTLLY